MHNKIKEYFETLDPTILGLKKVVVISIRELGVGEANINYLVGTPEKQFVFRLHFEHNTPNKPKEEYNILKSIETLNIAPKPFFFQIKNKIFGLSFIILEYIRGKALPNDHQLSDREFKILAKELASLHSNKKNENIPPNKLTYKGYLQRFKQEMSYLKKKFFIKNLGDVPLNQFEKINDLLNKEVKVSGMKNVLCITHGDVAPQNMVKINDKFKFIDWESAGIGDPAAEVAFVIDEIGFPTSEKQKKLFIKEYTKHRNDPTLVQRMNLFIKLVRFEQVLWSIKRIYEIKDKEVSTTYLEKENISDIISYLDFSIEKLQRIRLGNEKIYIEKNMFPSNFKIWV